MKAIDVSPVTTDMLDAILRLVRLVEASPEEREFIAPLIVREILYRLLVGAQGSRLSHLVAAGGDTHRISRTIQYLHQNFKQSIRMEVLAQEFGMSLSSFHHHFKAVTALSPLQFQKRMRLQEARRLMLGEQIDAAVAGFRVGYEDPAYFSRQYKQLFGAPPQPDIARLRDKLESFARPRDTSKSNSVASNPNR